MTLHHPHLVNAEAMAEAHPDTFTVPDERNDLKVGDFAKVCCNDERFWVKVMRAKEGIYVGAISNALVVPANRKMKFGDMIEFAGCNVYQAESPCEK